LHALESTGVPSAVVFPIQVLTHGGTAAVDQVKAIAEATPGVYTVLAPATPSFRQGSDSLISVIPTDEGNSSAGTATVARLRTALAGVPGGVEVGGNTAQNVDFNNQVYGNFPLMLAAIALLTFLLLVRAFRGDPAYHQRGAPTPYLRVLGPVLVVLTVTVFASGIAAYVGPSWMEPAALMTHKVSFYLWLIALVGHTVPHFAEALHLAGKDLSRRTSRLVPGLVARRTALITSIVIGAAVAAILSGHATEYLMRYPHIKHH